MPGAQTAFSTPDLTLGMLEPVERLIIRHLVNLFDLLLSSSEPLGVMRRQASRVYQSLGWPQRRPTCDSHLDHRCDAEGTI